MSREIQRRMEKLTEQLEALVTRQVLVIILERDPAPTWTEALPGRRCAYLIGGDDAMRAETLEALRTEATLPDGVILHDYTGKPGASRGIAEVVGGDGTANAAEVAIWGARGDRKTSAGLDAWLIVADRHRAAGGALPYRVIVPTGSHTEHKKKLCRTLAAPHWGNVWMLSDDDHVATATVDGVALLGLDLFGTSDPDALNRLRMECHGEWAEEAAPAAYEGGGGVTDEAWIIALTSMRMPAPARKVAVLTSNYPDEDFWGWQRFVVRPEPATVSVRIPPGESASAEDRERWRVALASRPDLLDRLVNGEPATIPQGPQVAVGYRADVHVAKAPIPVQRSLELWLAWDSAPNAHTHCCIIGQRNGRRRNVLACLVGELVPFEPQFLLTVVAWLQRHAPWTLVPGGNDWLYHVYDPSMNPKEVIDPALWRWGQIRARLGGHDGGPGPEDWPGRSGPMLTLLGDTDGAGGPALQIDPSATVLIKAFGGRWHYPVTRGGTVVRDLPAKPNHPFEDAGDAFCYLASIFAPERYRSRMQRSRGERRPTRTHFDVFARRP